MERSYVAKGRHRVVLVIPSLGIVVKFPRFRKRFLIEFWRDTIRAKSLGPFVGRWSVTKRKNWGWMFRDLKRALILTFMGMEANWGERSYYKHCSMYSRLLLQPTYLSFLGVINIQEFAEPAPIDESYTIYFAAEAIVGGEGMRPDGHHWSNARNFHLANGRLRVIDYGSAETQRILDEHGLSLYIGFDIEEGRTRYGEYKKNKTK